MNRLTRSGWLAALIVFTAAFTLYARTLAPSITWAHNGTDGGDLITAAATLGVPHPPGYPTYVSIGYLFSKIPIGDVAYRLNLMSAIFMSLAAALTTLTIIRRVSALTRSRFTREGIGMIAGLSFAAAPMVWGQATIAEVHGLNAFCVALVLFLIAPIIFEADRLATNGQRPAEYRLIIAALLWGLSLGNLITIGALAPLMILAWWKIYFIPNPASLGPKVRSASIPIVAFLIGLSIYGLVPMRASTQPPINWGNAISLENFWNQVTARLYSGYAFAVSLNAYPHRIIAGSQLVVQQFGWLGIILATIGIWPALTSRNKNWRWLILPIGIYLIFAFTYNTIDADLYLIPVWLLASWAIARGALSVIERITQHAQRFTAYSFLIIYIIILIIPVNTVLANFPLMDLSQDLTALQFTQELSTHLPRRAIVLTNSDAHTFTLWYYRAVEHWRPDVSVIDTRMSEADWYASMIVSQGGAPHLVPFDPEETWRERLRSANPDRPVCEVSALDTGQARIKCGE